MSEQTRDYLYEKFQNGDIPDQQDFQDLIDSSLSLVDDHFTRYKFDTPTGEKVWFGINNTSPDALLSIQGDTSKGDEMISFLSTEGFQKWNINLNPTDNDTPGFSIDDASSGLSNSRLFINNSGNVGIGTVGPKEKLHVEGIADGGEVSLRITNLATRHGGWLNAVVDDNAVTSRSGAFALIENNEILKSRIERLTILPTINIEKRNTYYRVGINEPLPYANLHVTRAEADPESDINLSENTGITVFGPIIGKNLGFDSHQIQARTGSFVSPKSPVMQFKATDLNIQPLGGNTTFHIKGGGTQQVIITNEGLVGIGKMPIERLDLDSDNGAITFGDTSTSSPAEGTVRWHAATAVSPADLEVFKDGAWKSLTTQTVTSDFWTAGAVAGSIYYEPETQNAKVGIGTATPTESLTILENTTGVQGNNYGARITNTATAVSGSISTRAGLNIELSGEWSTDSGAVSAGLYISNVSGQKNPNGNVGAVINGSVVIGNTTGHSIVGTNGTNVLAIQSGVAPTSIAGITANSGVQVYSDELTGSDGVDFSALHILSGDNNLIKLYKQGYITANNPNVPDSGNVITDDIIIAMRQRILDLESVLINLGLITKHP